MNQCTCGDMSEQVRIYGRPVHGELCPAREGDRFCRENPPPPVHTIHVLEGIKSQEFVGGIK